MISATTPYRRFVGFKEARKERERERGEKKREKRERKKKKGRGEVKKRQWRSDGKTAVRLYSMVGGGGGRVAIEVNGWSKVFSSNSSST